MRMAVVDGKVVSGGGCLEAWSAMVVSRFITTDAHLLTLPSSVTPHHILKVIFSRYFLSVQVHCTTRLSQGISGVPQHINSGGEFLFKYHF